MAKSDGTVVIGVGLDIKNAEKKLGELRNKIETLEKELNEAQSKRPILEEQAKKDADALADENRKLQEMKDHLDDLRKRAKDMNLPQKLRAESIAAIPQQLKNVDAQQSIVNAAKIQANASSSELNKLNSAITKTEEKLRSLKSSAGKLAEKINQSAKNTRGLASETSKADNYMEKFVNRVKGLARRVFVFTLITKAFRSIKDYMWKSIKTNNDAVSAVANLKGALLTLAQPITEFVIPAFTKFVNILTRVISVISALVSKIFGTTNKKSSESAKNLYEEQKALEGVGGAADDAAGSLAGFDEINTISSEDSAGGGASTSSDIEPDFTSGMEQQLDAIAAVVGAALLALGAILTFTGANIPLGLALMAAGAALLISAIAENWDAVKENIGGSIAKLLEILAPAFLVIGMIILMSGVNIPLGIALVAIGAIGMASEIVANWDTVKEELQGPLGALTALLSTAFLILGAILTFSGANIPLGIALLVLGAAGLAITIAANWDVIKEKLQGQLGDIIIIVSAALLVLGIILLLTGAGIPLGLGLIAVGAIGLAATIAARWESFKALMGGKINAIVAIVSAALLVLGIILLLTGAGIPLGLGLIAVGAVGLAKSVAPRWDFIKDKCKEIWESVKQWWNANVAKITSPDWWLDLGKKMLDGLFDGLKSAWDKIKSWATSVVDWFTDLFGGAQNSVSSLDSTAENLSTASINDAEISVASIPRLAAGAVIPPNREFMAVLGDQRRGTNVEAPLSTIKQALVEALTESGAENGGTYTFVVNLDGRELARSTIRNINDLTTSAGRPLLKV